MFFIHSFCIPWICKTSVKGYFDISNDGIIINFWIKRLYSRVSFRYLFWNFFKQYIHSRLSVNPKWNFSCCALRFPIFPRDPFIKEPVRLRILPVIVLECVTMLIITKNMRTTCVPDESNGKRNTFLLCIRVNARNRNSEGSREKKDMPGEDDGFQAVGVAGQYRASWDESSTSLENVHAD